MCVMASGSPDMRIHARPKGDHDVVDLTPMEQLIFALLVGLFNLRGTTNDLQKINNGCGSCDSGGHGSCTSKARMGCCSGNHCCCGSDQGKWHSSDCWTKRRK